MLEIQNVSKTFNAGTVNEKTALNGLNLKLNEGDFVTVIGGNGAGKSTMLNAVAGVWPVDEGKILIDGVDVTKLGGASARCLHRPRVPGPHDRHGGHHADRRESGTGCPPRQAPHPPHRHHQGGAGAVP